MKNSIYLITFFSMLHFGCGGQTEQQEDLHNGDENLISTPKYAPNQLENQQWLSYYNATSDSLAYLYEENAVKILAIGEVINGNTQIARYLLSDSLKLVSIKSDTVITAHVELAIAYEISESTYSNGEKYKALVIWQTKNGNRKRVLEFTSKIDSAPYPLAALDDRRDLWISLCNNHDAKELIQELYSENTLYYNHKPLIKGRESLLAEYQYMNDKAYQLSLQPEIIEKVNKDFVFEIGQCVGSYGGKYILIWKKEEDGVWRIFIDSNI